jgi:hypothetical protein
MRGQTGIPSSVKYQQIKNSVQKLVYCVQGLTVVSTSGKDEVHSNYMNYTYSRQAKIS